MSKIANIRIYGSPSCPKDSFYFADAQQLEKIKEFDKIFKRAQKIDKRNAILNSVDANNFMFLEQNSRREGKLE